MGNRYTWFEKCPECPREVEYYDAPSSLMYIANCVCGWSEPRDYYELSMHEIALFTPEEYEEWQKESGHKALNDMNEKEFEEWQKKHA